MPDGGNTYSPSRCQSQPGQTTTQLVSAGREQLAGQAPRLPNFAVTGGVERAGARAARVERQRRRDLRGASTSQQPRRVVEIDLAAHRVVNELQVWNPDYAFAYPVLAVNARDEVGIMLGFGGNNHHANCAMGILGDFVVWYRDDSSRTVERFGDYLTTRPAQRHQSRFGAWGYFVTKVPTFAEPCTYHPFYACYGRASA